MSAERSLARTSMAARLCVAALFVSAVYLYGFPSPTVHYIAIVGIHAFGGLIALLACLAFLPKLRSKPFSEIVGWILFGAGGALGCVLLKIGATRPHWSWLYAHIVVSAIAVVLLAACWTSERRSGRAALVLRAAI